MDKFKFIMSELWDFLKPVILFLMSEVGKALATSAMTAVKVVAENMGKDSNADKRDAAFRMITNDLKSKGIEVGASAVNMAIEAAVQKLKEKAK